MEQGITGAEQEILRKHETQMRNHERLFGKLGEQQTKDQKSALKKALNESVSKSPNVPKPPTKKVGQKNG